VAAGGLPGVSEAQFSLLAGSLSDETAVVTRSAAAVALAEAPRSAAQLMQLCDRVQAAGPLELNRLLGAFAHGNGDELGLRLLAALRAAPALPSLRIDLLRQTLANYSPAVQEGVNELESLVNVDAAAQRARIEELLPQMAGGDVRRGHVVFHSSKASCSACHRMGIAGGVVGPDLSHIGEARTERDLLESILFPSLSFVRSYESVLILTAEGKALGGRIRDETDQEYILVTGPNEETRVRRDDVEEIQPSTVSVMPAGLDKQLSPRELADLVAFLKNAK
jgi:putative heme-binding domain-containing protein